MFGKDPRLNPPTSRKQLLIAESELNRAQLVGDLAALAAGVRTLSGRAKSFGVIASAAAALAVGLTAFRRGQSGDAGAKPFWLQTIFKGVSAISTLWQTFRPPGRAEKNN
jgi:hypothetical protein